MRIKPTLLVASESSERLDAEATAKVTSSYELN
jgi:hypothetical protein